MTCERCIKYVVSVKRGLIGVIVDTCMKSTSRHRRSETKTAGGTTGTPTFVEKRLLDSRLCGRGNVAMSAHERAACRLHSLNQRRKPISLAFRLDHLHFDDTDPLSLRISNYPCLALANRVRCLFETDRLFAVVDLAAAVGRMHWQVALVLVLRAD